MPVNNPLNSQENIVAAANDAIAIDSGRESSMLNAQERVAAAAMIKRLLKHYQKDIQKKGGVDKVLEEYENYLVGKIGDPLSKTSTTHRQGLDSYKTALRTLLDPALGQPRNPGEVDTRIWKNVLHKGAPVDAYPVDDGLTIDFRHFAALMYLAASDKKREIPPEVLVDGATRESIIEASLLVYTMKIAEIRRAHNGPGEYYSENSEIDSPSCRPGTYGRLAKSVIYNPVAEMPVNPTVEFPRKSEAFIFETFEKMSDEIQMKIYDLMEDRFVMMTDIEDIEEDKKESLQFFLETLKKREQEFIEHISEEYGQSANLKVARKIYQDTLSSMDLIGNADAKPNQNLTTRINQFIFEKKKAFIINAANIEISKSFSTWYGGLLAGWKTQIDLISSVKDKLHTLDNASISALERTIIQEQNNLIEQEKKGESIEVEKGRKYYEEKFKENQIEMPDKLKDATFTDLKVVQESREGIATACANWDAQFTTFKTHLLEERQNRIDTMLKEFVVQLKNEKKLATTISEISNEVDVSDRNLKEYIKAVDVNGKEVDLGPHELKFNKIGKKLNAIEDEVSNRFIDFCKSKNFDFTMDDAEGVLTRIQNSDELKIKHLSARFSKYGERFEGAKFKKGIRDNYELHLTKVQELIVQIILNLHQEMGEKVKHLKARHPAKGSKAFKQMQAFNVALNDLKVFVKNPIDLKDKNIDNLLRNVQKIETIVNHLDKACEKIGYPGTLKKFLAKIKVGINRCLNTLFKCKLDVSRTIEKNEIHRIVTFSAPKFIDSPSFEKLKNQNKASMKHAIDKLKSVEIEKPGYAKGRIRGA